MQADLKALQERVEAATGPDRQIDCLLDCLRHGREFIEWTADTGIVGYRYKHPKLGWDLGCWRVGYTASIDAALALAEEKFPGRATDILREAVSAEGKRHHRHCQYAPLDVAELARDVLAALLRALQSKPTSLPPSDAENT